MTTQPNTSQTVSTPASSGHVVNGSSATETHATDVNSAGNGHQRYDFELGGFKFGV